MPYESEKAARKCAARIGNILCPLSKRRHVEGNHVEPVKKILAKSVPADFLLQLFVGCRYYAHVHRYGLIGTQRFHALLFQYPQHLRLGFEAHVAHFIQKERATIGLLKFPDLVFARASETSFAMPEHFRLDQLFWNCRAIHFDERHRIARTARMKRTSDQLLARAAFAEYQHAPIRRRGQLDLLPERLHLHASAQNLVALPKFGAKAAILVAEPQIFKSVADD